MADIQAELARVLREHGAPIGGRDTYPGDEYDCCTEEILKRFLVVPRSDIQGWEFAARSTVAGSRWFSHLGPDRVYAEEFTARRRNAQINVVGESDTVLVQRPILLWMPISEDGEG